MSIGLGDRTFSVRMPNALISELDAVAVEVGKSRSDLIRTFCEIGLEEHAKIAEAAMRDREAREYFAKFLIEKGLAKPRQVATEAFFYGAAPVMWLKRVEKVLGVAVADEVAAKMAEIMGKSDELAAYLAED